MRLHDWPRTTRWRRRSGGRGSVQRGSGSPQRARGGGGARASRRWRNSRAQTLRRRGRAHRAEQALAPARKRTRWWWRRRRSVSRRRDPTILSPHARTDAPSARAGAPGRAGAGAGAEAPEVVVAAAALDGRYVSLLLFFKLTLTLALANYIVCKTLVSRGGARTRKRTTRASQWWRRRSPHARTDALYRRGPVMHGAERRRWHRRRSTQGGAAAPA